MRKLMLLALLLVLLVALSECRAGGKGKGKKKKKEKGGGGGGDAVAAGGDTSVDETSDSESEVSEGEEGEAEGGGKKSKKDRKKERKRKRKLKQKERKAMKKKLKKEKRKSKKQRDNDRRRRAAGKPLGKKRGKKRRTSEERQKQLAACAKKEGGCRGQSEKARKKREETKETLKDRRRKLIRAQKLAQNKENATTPEEEAEMEQEVEQIFSKTMEAKRAMLKAQGFSPDEVEPDDDGLWGGDTVLTVEQAERIIRFQNETDDDNTTLTAPPPPPGGGNDTDDEGDQVVDTPARKKRYAIFMEENAGALWTSFPIPYTFDNESKFTEEQKQKVRQGIADIEQKSCIRFEELTYIPAVSHMFFIKRDFASFCGLSGTGRMGLQNSIELNFAECDYQIVGTTIHSVLHALGLNHEQIRYDRNEYVTLNTENMDPKMTDLFEPGDNTVSTGYGTQYDYFSIMHLSAWIASVDEDIPTIVPKKEPADVLTEVMGQHEAMSPKDAELLRKMYCDPECNDLEVWCGWWATDGLCAEHRDTFLDFCPKSCGFCPIAATSLARDLVANPL